MRLCKRITSIALTIFVLTASFMSPNFLMTVFAEDISPQEPPEKMRIEAKNPDEPPIGYNEFDNYYADFKWDAVKVPVDAVTGYLNIYLQEINKPYRPATPLLLRERDLPAGTTQIRLKGLNSGTIYNTYMTAYHTHTDGDTTFNSPMSLPSNTVKFMTDIKIGAVASGVNKLKIEWDDVWNSGRRIDYKLYISENKEFNNTQPIYIGQSQIEPLGPVKVNQTTGKLEYEHTVKSPGRVYYIKIAPDINEPELKKSPESQTIAVSSYIIARTTKVATTEAGNIWRIDWSPVVTGLGDIEIVVTYQIYRGNISTDDIPQYMASVDDTNFFITLPPGDIGYYYIIRASITKNSAEVYPGIKIESDKVIVKEQDVLAYPAVPELVEAFERAPGDAIISYSGELKPNSATLLWRVPKKGDNQVDLNVLYDIWLVGDPNLLDSPPDTTKIATDLQMTSSNQIMNGVELIGYKYTLSNLTPNSTYYFKIVAKKKYIDYVDNVLQDVVCTSEPALKIIITPTEGPIDQPKVPSRPPFGIKKSTDGKDLITSTSATIQLKNKWYEQFNTVSGKWEYVRTEKLNQSDTPPYVPDPSTLDGKNYRVVEYDSGVTIDVGCVEFIDGMSYNDIANIPANKITRFPVTANDPTEDPTLNVDKKKHNIKIDLTNLTPNTTYIVWVRAARLSVSLLSGPSDPIIITTVPKTDPPGIKPTVPIFNYNLPGDTFIDLGWDFSSKYKYTLKYGTVENVNSAIGTLTIEPKDFAEQSFYKVKDLTQNSLYFFWIQAEAIQGGLKSEWSDSYSVKTLPLQAPNTPRGFGIKNAPDSVTKNSLTFEWIKEDGIEYKLQIATDVDYKEFKDYNAGTVSEYKVDGLRSNFRYYARLIARDSEKNLDSKPTLSVTVRTERSNDDYDSDQDIENIISGDYITKEPTVVNNTWAINVTGSNADRFIEHVQNDKVLDYKIDLTKPPAKATKLNIAISGKVFKALDSLKECLIITANSDQNGIIQLVVRPETFNTQVNNMLINSTYEISINSPGTTITATVKNLTFKTKDFNITIGVSDGSNSVSVTKLNQPLKVLFPYTDSTWYKEGTTSGYVYDPNLLTWKKLSTSASYDTDNMKGQVSVETLLPGKIAIAESGNDYFDDTKGHWAESSICNVASVHPLKSIPGRLFEPDKNVKLGDAVKLMLDVMDYTYDNDYMISAERAQIINSSDVENPDALCPREKAISMAVRLYEIKTGKAATPLNTQLTAYTDLNKVSAPLYSKIKFAIQNGIVVGRNSNTLDPGNPVTRGEIMALLEKMMLLAGEL